ncbi:MAG: glycosyltransferase family 39 protein [bacterium]|nr:glycosyltransferase family 39 protein [bacterium]
MTGLKVKITLTLILIVGMFLRLFELGSIPRGLHVDEVSLGNSADSILKTGTDISGKNQLPGYLYASIPFIALFDLNSTSIRLVSAVSGVLSILGVYLLTSLLIDKSKPGYNAIPLIAATLLTITPWSIHLSRAAFEANFAFTLLIFAIYTFITFYNHKKLPIGVLSIILFSSTIFTYSPYRFITPVLIIILFSYYFNHFAKRHIVSLSLLFIMLSLPIMSNRLIGSDTNLVTQELNLGISDESLGPILGFLQKFLIHFNADYLFFKGDYSARNSLKEFGLLLLPQLPFIAIGLYKSFVYNNKSKLVIYSLIILSPVSSALSTLTPHALKSYSLLLPLTIVSSIGLYHSTVFIKNIKLQRAIIGLIAILFSYSFISYTHIYYKHYPLKSSWDWNEESTIVAQHITSNYSNNQRVVIECDPGVLTKYLKFYSTNSNHTNDTINYVLVKNLNETQINNGDIVAIYGFRDPPPALKNYNSLTMNNQAIAYKVGKWNQNEK